MKVIEKTDWQTLQLKIAMHNLTANLLRIMAGAGRIVDLEKQFKETNDLVQNACQESLTGCEATFEETLQLSWPYIEAKTDNARDFNEEQYQISSIVRASLRIAAAKLDGNNSQLSKANSDLCNSLRHYKR